jgi:hypothetical protein
MPRPDMLSDQPTTEFAATVKKKTDKAVLLDFGDAEHWIPLSQCEWASKDTWRLTDWIARQKELIE